MIKFDVRRPKVRHLLAIVGILAILIWVTDIPSRWRYHHRRVSGFAFREEMYRGQADFLVNDVPKLRDRPKIESRDGHFLYMTELAKQDYLDLHVNSDDWAAAFARNDRANRVKAAELHTLAAQASAQRRNSWWRYWGTGETLGTPTTTRPPKP